MRKVLLFIFFIVLCIALVYKSPFSAMYNYNKAKALYQQGQYEQSLPYFEKSLFADSRGILARFFYVMALSKSKPVYSVQKKLFEMADSKINDEASRYAKSQVMYMRYKLLDGIENNYIYNAAMGNDILRWDIRSFPLRVYIENGESVPSYYMEAVNKALLQWTNRTNFVKFKSADNADNADIIIRFKDIPSDVCSGDFCKYAVAYTEPEISSEKLLKRMILTVYKTNPKNQNFTSYEVFNTVLHELGHTLGIMGHSDNPNDLMYSIKDSDVFIHNLLRREEQALTMRDLKTLVLLYRIEPTISNVKNLHSENFYYAPLIMGQDDVRLKKKLDEFRIYIKNYPNMAAGYINIASVYVDLGDYTSAMHALKEAETRTNTEDERYMIQYNRSVIYFNQQDYENALKYANLAKAIRDDKSIQDLIDDILKLK